MVIELAPESRDDPLVNTRFSMIGGWFECKCPRREWKMMVALRCAGAERAQAALAQLAPSQREALYWSLEPLHQLLLTPGAPLEESTTAFSTE